MSHDSRARPVGPRLTEEGALPARTLEQLLQNSIALQAAPADPSSSENVVAEMKPEDAEWLKNALNGIFRDPSKEMRKVISAIEDFLRSSPVEEESIESVEQLTEHLRDFIVDLDLANDFAKAGGLELIKILLDRDEARLRVLGCELTGELAQNNEFGVHCVITHPSIFAKLISIAADEKNEETEVRVKGVSAIAGTVRDSQEAQRLFYDHNGAELITELLGSGHEKGGKLQLKTVFLLQSMIEWDKTWHEKLFELGIIQTLANMYKNGKQSEGNAFHEMIMNALVMFATVDTTRTIKVLKDNKVDFKDTLKTREETINAYGDSSPYLEELTGMKRLQKLLN